MRPRRKFIKSAGLFLGSAAIAGARVTPSVLFEDNAKTDTGEFKAENPKLIDIHVHTHFERHPGVTRPRGSFPPPEALIEMMNEAGISKAVVLPVVSPERRYTLVIPEEILEICSLYPDRLIPFCNLDPRYLSNSPKSDFLPLLTAYKDLGCKGVGEYFPNIPLDDPLNINLFKQIEEVGLPLLFHLAPAIGGYYGCYDEPGMPRLEKVLRQCPELVILGHSQVFWAEIGGLENPDERGGYPRGPIKREGRVVELMRNYPNLHGDLAAGSGLNAISRDPEFGYRFMEEFQDRLYFGNDITSVGQKLPHIPYFSKLKEERLISEAAFEKITWKNATKLLLE